MNTFRWIEETLGWTEDGLLSTHTIVNTNLAARPVDARGYGYAGSSRRLVEEQSDMDGVSVPVTVFRSTDSTWTNQWRAGLEVSPGAHQLTVSATLPSGLATTNASSWFTNSAPNENVSDTFDAAGQLTQRVWKSPSGTTNRTQTLTWDARGRLFKVLERDGNTNGYDWSASYDAFGRRLQTVTILVTNGVAISSQPSTINQFYDPQVEFLELGVSLDGQTTWKLYGPDLNGVYGGMNGTGGLDAILPAPLGFWFTIADAQGNVLGYGRDSTSMVWNPSRPTGYGAIPGYRPPALGPGISLAASAAWRGRWPDITGYVWLGARYYNPEAGNWLSFDPVWNGRDPNYFTFCGGDPINVLDPDGRSTLPYNAKNPATWVLPKPGSGYWTGAVGDSPFKFRSDSSYFKTYGSVLNYVKGVPDLSPWQVDPTVKGVCIPGRVPINMTGDHTVDRGRAIAEMSKRSGVSAPDIAAALGDSQFHHWHNNEMILVPADVNGGIPHSGPASAARAATRAAALLEGTGSTFNSGLKLLSALTVLDLALNPGDAIGGLVAGPVLTVGDATAAGGARSVLGISNDPSERLSAYEALEGLSHGGVSVGLSDADAHEFVGLQMAYGWKKAEDKASTTGDLWNAGANLGKKPR